MTNEEVELGKREWPRVEKVGVRGEELLDPPEESRECAGEYGDGDNGPMLSSDSLKDPILGNEKERNRLMFYYSIASRGYNAQSRGIMF